MRKHEKVPATQKQYGELAGALIGEMNFSKDEETALIGRLGGFRRQVREFYAQFQDRVELSSDLVGWNSVYEKLFGKVPNWDGVIVPAKPEGFGPSRLIAVPQDICEWTNNKPIQGTFNALVKYFPCRQYASELDRMVDNNVRAPQMGSYAVWVKDVREADDTFDTESVVGITLLERELLEADYFFEHGEHLDPQMVTRCSGSRYSDGDVPRVDWIVSGFSVDGCDASRRSSALRSRSVRF